jgi:hypothetical protein
LQHFLAKLRPHKLKPGLLTRTRGRQRVAGARITTINYFP